MCFGSTPKVKSTPPPPTAASTGEDTIIREARKKERERQRAMAGFQQNILGGSMAATDTTGTKKQLLGQ